MAGGIQGADLAQLQQLVQQLGGPFQTELQSTLNGMNQKVQASTSYWVARNADHVSPESANPWTINRALTRVPPERASPRSTPMGQGALSVRAA